MHLICIVSKDKLEHEMDICVKILFYTVLFVATDRNRFRDCGQCDTLVLLIQPCSHVNLTHDR